MGCTTCKIIIVAVVAVLVTLLVGVTITSGGAAASAIVGAGKLVSLTITAAAAIAKALIILIAAGFSYLIGDYLCCKLGVTACCIKDSVEFWTDLGKRLENGGGSLNGDDCAALSRTIDRLVKAGKIDSDTEATLRDELKQHCPG